MSRTADESPSLIQSTSTNYSSLPNVTILSRIYIGSIQFDVSEKEISAVFSIFGPLRSLNMMMDTVNKRHKGFGFVEFETPEAAALAQSCMDGSELAGRQIKVGRPQNFPVDLPPGVPRPFPSRIYVANIHELIQESEIRTIFEAFGPIKHCNLVPDLVTRQHKGYGFVEFEQANNATEAIQALHDFELAGRQLKVGKTVVGGPIPSGMSSLSNEPVAQAKPRVPTAVLRAAQQINAALGGPTSLTIILSNLEDYAQAKADPSLLEELQLDVREECEDKFGAVQDCSVLLDDLKRDVKARITFSDGSAAQEAIRIMDKRWFGGRQISAYLEQQL